MQKSTAVGKLFRLMFQVVSVFFLIPSFLFFCLGCYRIAPETFAPVLKQDSFRAGQLAVDSTYYVPGAKGGRATKYSVGHIIEQEGANVHEFTVDASEISPADTDSGDVVTVYYAQEFKKVYLRKPKESLKRMPAYKVVSPFIFWAGMTVLPFPLFLYGCWLYRRDKRIEKQKTAANPRERWVQ